MADLVKKIKIKKQDGTFTDYIPIGAEAENVNVDGESVELKLNKKPYYYNTVADMKADTKLKAGDTCQTLGYYLANDGGAGLYQIVDNNTLVDDGGSVHELENGLRVILLNENQFINVRQYGAKGNNITDDTQAFTNVINKANITNQNIFIPNGMYNIYSDLPTIYDGIQIIGGETSLKTENGTIINDYRETSTYLLNFEKIREISRVGGGIKNITFIAKTNTLGQGCIKINNTNSGWTSIVENIRVANYFGTAIDTNANDYRFINCMIHHCSASGNSNTYYAVQLENSCNENRFIGCHFEHCRYVLKTSGSNFLNEFSDTKIEMSTARMTKTNLSAPIKIETTNSNPTFSFVGCSFINLDINAYIQSDSSLAYSNVPAMIEGNDSAIININGCNFCCGNGSGVDYIAIAKQSKFINITQGNITGNNFVSPSYFTPAIVSKLAIIKDNYFSIKKVESSEYPANYNANNIFIIDNTYSSSSSLVCAPLGNNNRFIGPASPTIFVPPYKQFDSYTYLSGDGNTSKFSYNYPVSPAGSSYLTLVIQKINSYSELFSIIKVSITRFGTDYVRGDFTLDAYHSSGNVNKLVLKDDSNFQNSSTTNKIHCSLKDGNIYIQVLNSGSSLLPILMTASGFESQQYCAYVDRSITTLIDSPSLHIEI